MIRKFKNSQSYLAKAIYFIDRFELSLKLAADIILFVKHDLRQRVLLEDRGELGRQLRAHLLPQAKETPVHSRLKVQDPLEVLVELKFFAFESVLQPLPAVLERTQEGE